jgi:hypothetical protein
MIQASANPGRSPLFLCLVVGVLAGGCARPSSPPAGSEPESQPATLPQIAAVGGVQDVWPFSFGFDANQDVLEQILGTPVGTELAQVGTDGGANVEKWFYEGLEFMFFTAEGTEQEHLLSVRINSPEIELRGGLALGMVVEQVVTLMGEPSLRRDDRLVYFYYATTIELTVENGRISEVSLSRAMP